MNTNDWTIALEHGELEFAHCGEIIATMTVDKSVSWRSFNMYWASPVHTEPMDELMDLMGFPNEEPSHVEHDLDDVSDGEFAIMAYTWATKLGWRPAEEGV